MSQERILVVDDEREIGELIRDYLEAEGYSVHLAFDGEEALHQFHSFTPDLAILDIMLPKIDGMELCRKMRNESAIPILMLSAKKSDVDKILGLGLGADDYVTKPFSPSELVARVKAQLRRYTQLSAPVQKAQNQDTLRFKDLEIDLKGHNVLLKEKEVHLTTKEFAVLRYLAMHPEQVFTREQIFDQIWGFNEVGDLNTVTVHIRKIREKIEADTSNPRYIQTVWGVGYKFIGDKR